MVGSANGRDFGRASVYSKLTRRVAQSARQLHRVATAHDHGTRTAELTVNPQDAAAVSLELQILRPSADRAGHGQATGVARLDRFASTSGPEVDRAVGAVVDGVVVAQGGSCAATAGPEIDHAARTECAGDTAIADEDICGSGPGPDLCHAGIDGEISGKRVGAGPEGEVASAILDQTKA